MKKVLLLLALAISSSAFATPVTINDSYIGGDSHGHGDVIGQANMFGITSMEVDLVGTTLSVTINTPFGDSGLGTFGSYTDTPLALERGIGFGDLFLSSTGWNPAGPAPYLTDNHLTGTVWDYGVSLADRWSRTSGSSLYGLDAVTGNPDAYISDDFLSGATYRNGQEVAVNTGTATLLTNATNFSSVAGTNTVVFSLDIAGTDLASAGAIGLHWAMTCGNDTIEGNYTVVSVPEPSSIAIVLLGLLCVGTASVRRRRSAIGVQV